MTEFCSKFIKRGKDRGRGLGKGRENITMQLVAELEQPRPSLDMRVSAFSYTCRINAEHHCRPNLDIMMIVPSVLTGESSFVYDVYFIALLQ